MYFCRPASHKFNAHEIVLTMDLPSGLAMKNHKDELHRAISHHKLASVIKANYLFVTNGFLPLLPDSTGAFGAQ